MARQARYYHHGQSPAAWTGTIIATIGFVVVFVAIFLGPAWVGVGVGAGLVLLGGIVTMVMKAMGLGQP
ncbi:HGxxPAAW family protein [uncultured Tessaracoccus sp.]|uniref:HGxxPAAW family protein n=1 Tax=uncultured Tessaracoccus sp. TaxID=905023 RepID=UPI0025D5C7F4|nr:HGxxPAAW family protein [uncultured Tessaracoccus sp.]